MTAVYTLTDCISDVTQWLAQIIHLNGTSTDFNNLASFQEGNNLGAILDNDLKFDVKISSVVKMSFYQLPTG